MCVMLVRGWVVIGLGMSVLINFSVRSLFKISLSKEVSFLLSRMAQTGKEIQKDK